MNRDDPCFRCPLPDCDERHQRCVLRRLRNSYFSKIHSGQKELITDEEREASNRIFAAWSLDRAAEASEGGRPYRRGNKEYGAPQP